MATVIIAVGSFGLGGVIIPAAVDASTALEMLGGGGAQAILAVIVVVLAIAYWREKTAHDATKENERKRLLQELDFLNRNRGSDNV